MDSTIRLMVKCIDNHDQEYFKYMTIGHLKIGIMKRDGINLGLVNEYHVYRDGDLLPEDKRIVDCGFPEGAILEITNGDFFQK